MRRPLLDPSLNEHTQSMQRQTAYLDEQFTVLAAQSACVQERRRTLRERQRSQLALALLVIPPPHFEREVDDNDCLHSGGSNDSEEPRSRFSHSRPSSPVAMRSPISPTTPTVPRKRKSILAKLIKALVL